MSTKYRIFNASHALKISFGKRISKERSNMSKDTQTRISRDHT
jgi:hypothetical protein